MFTGEGDLSCRAIFDWSSGTIVGMTAANAGFYASNDPAITTGGTGDISDLITSDASFSFGSDPLQTNVANGNMFCNNNCVLNGNSFAAAGAGSISSSLESAVLQVVLEI